jgi:hypothetical protein
MIICSLQLGYPKNYFLEACKSDTINYGSPFAIMLSNPLKDYSNRCVIINFTKSNYILTWSAPLWLIIGLINYLLIPYLPWLNSNRRFGFWAAQFYYSRSNLPIYNHIHWIWNVHLPLRLQTENYSFSVLMSACTLNLLQPRWIRCLLFKPGSDSLYRLVLWFFSIFKPNGARWFIMFRSFYTKWYSLVQFWFSCPILSNAGSI